MNERNISRVKSTVKIIRNNAWVLIMHFRWNYYSDTWISSQAPIRGTQLQLQASLGTQNGNDDQMTLRESSVQLVHD
jgi:hypothetical protein